MNGMKLLFFPKLAWTGIRKNRQLYLPYLISAAGVIMLFYVISALSFSDLIRQTKGGTNVLTILGLGKFVVAAFALLFLIYTNSLVIRRRYKEFGLYSILGMDKRGMVRLLLWETLITAGLSLTGGIVTGILLSKLAELGLFNAIHAEITYTLSVSLRSIGAAVGLFGCAFLLLFIRSVIHVCRTGVMQLLKSETDGEKPPKANWLLAVAGMVILGVAYYLAVTIRSPLTALMLFFVAVIMVIVATYLLFISGSVTLCRLLQKSKRYYYRKDHFVSVSSMAYRMKRNGAGLASICILSTMVLVIVASTTSLYFGAEDSIRARFPRNTVFDVQFQKLEQLTNGETDRIRQDLESVFDRTGVKPAATEEYHCVSTTALQKDGGVMEPDATGLNSYAINYDDVRALYFVDCSDYEHMTENTLVLQPGQAAVFGLRCSYPYDTMEIRGVRWEIAGSGKWETSDKNGKPFIIGEASSIVVPSILVVIPSYDDLLPLDDLTVDGESMTTKQYCYRYDLDADDDTVISVAQEQADVFENDPAFRQDDCFTSMVWGTLPLERNDFYYTFGGLFFLGVILSVLFIFAAAMIIYYKQVAEGYEDRQRFAIMQKVGMTARDIRRSINSQMLTVFFAPLTMAGIHLVFSFPMVWKMLQLFNLNNLPLVIGVTAGAFVLFGIFYGLIYKITAGIYYRLVSSGDTQN